MYEIQVSNQIDKNFLVLKVGTKKILIYLTINLYFVYACLMLASLSIIYEDQNM